MVSSVTSLSVSPWSYLQADPHGVFIGTHSSYSFQQGCAAPAVLLEALSAGEPIFTEDGNSRGVTALPQDF